jgi:hypothetical protein
MRDGQDAFESRAGDPALSSSLAMPLDRVSGHFLEVW